MNEDQEDQEEVSEHSPDPRKVMAQIQMGADQLWKLAEEPNVLNIIEQLRKSCEVEDGEVPDAMDTTIALCATLVYGEIVRRKIAQKYNEEV